MPGQDRTVRLMAAVILVYTVAVCTGALLLFGAYQAGGVLAGGLIAWLNLLWLASLVRALLDQSRSPGSFGARLAAKELLLFICIGGLLWFKLVDPVGLIVGLSGLLAGVTAGSVRWWLLAGEEPGGQGK